MDHVLSCPYLSRQDTFWLKETLPWIAERWSNQAWDVSGLGEACTQVWLNQQYYQVPRTSRGRLGYELAGFRDVTLHSHLTPGGGSVLYAL